jgi:hypothetical protein
MPLVIAILLGLSAAAIVVYPLVVAQTPTAPNASPAALLDANEREQSAKQALREVDFDYRLGNLEASDYAALREKYERHALVALKARVERERAADKLIDQELARLRAQQAKRGNSRGRGARDNAATSQPANGSARVESNGDRPTTRGPRTRRRKGA